MIRLSASSDDVAEIEADALILGIIPGGEVTTHANLPEDIRTALTETARPLEPEAKVGATTILASPLVKAPRVVLVGLGEGNDADLRESAGAASRACGKRPGRIAVALPALTDSACQAVAEGLLLGSYRFDRYLTPKSDGPAPEPEWLIAGASDSALARAVILAEAVNGARDLVNTPPLDLYPESFAETAQTATSGLGVDVRVWNADQLEKEGFGGLIAVGSGSLRPPRLIRLEWKPEGARETVALVGKGITFDTGGISLKTNDGMATMKSDMAGAAAVLGIVCAAARLKLPIAVTGWLCLAENMPSGSAQRPSDVIRVHGGTTVEVMNTDAEGRLVLADGLDRAREEKPTVLIDIATLTGAQGLALGARTCGVMGTPSVRDAIVGAAGEAGEGMWAMPLPDHLREGLESKVADLRNVSNDRMGGMLTAGLFLREFAGDTPWAHVDIARPAFNEGGPYGATPSGGTGIAVRTMLRFLENRCGA
ncbi:MAG: leucyl aminopeptidase [Demequinaceae bacterium]|nr:leucyl aminopeptidase [Demequinaceae bacterium]